MESNRSRAAAVAVAPLVLAAGLVAHPYLPFLPDEDGVADAVVAGTTRWGLAHLGVAVASGLLILAFLAVRSHLRERGQAVSGLAVALIVMGGTLFAVLPGLEFAPLAAAETGGDVRGAQAALTPWFLPTLITAALTWALGVIGFARTIARSGILGARATQLVVGSLVVMAVARFVPVGIVQFYVHAAAALAGLWPLAYQMWTQPSPAAEPQPARMASA